jgi:hypothetical protein
MCFNPSPVRRVPSPNRYIAVARFCFCKNNKRTIDRCDRTRRTDGGRALWQRVATCYLVSLWDAAPAKTLSMDLTMIRTRTSALRPSSSTDRAALGVMPCAKGSAPLDTSATLRGAFGFNGTRVAEVRPDICAGFGLRRLARRWTNSSAESKFPSLFPSFSWPITPLEAPEAGAGTLGRGWRELSLRGAFGSRCP